MVLGILRRAAGAPLRAVGDVTPVPRGAGLIAFQVLDTVGAPLPGAEVTGTDAATGATVRLGITDPNGTFTGTAAAGEYRLAITAEGFRTHRADARIEPGSAASLGRFRLEPAAAPDLPERGYWEIDPGHTAIRFIARHIGLAHVHGRFENFAGSVHIADRIEDSSIEITIDAASLNSGVKLRDDHLRSKDFLDVEQYPYLHFAGDRFAYQGGSKWSVAGTLTLHGVSRSVRLDTDYLGAGTGMQGESRVACFASTELHREDFTLNYQTMLAKGIAAIGATMRVELDVQAVYRGTELPAEWV